MKWGSVLGVALPCLAGLAGLVGCDEVPAPRFPHRAHLTASDCGGTGQPECPTCLSCHAGIRQPKGRATLSPGDCTTCHQSSAPEVSAVVDRLSQGGPSSQGIEFDHPSHLQLPEIHGQCVKCHVGVAEDGTAGNMFPKMSACLQCHDDDFDRGQCTPCHRQPQLRALVPKTFLRHDGDFLRDHGRAATRQAQVCSQCHTQDTCLACHDQSQSLTVETRNPDAIDRRFIHRGDFITRHPIEARSAPATCLSCHTTSSCDSCHVERGVSAARIGSANPHPVGWIGPNTASSDFHGRAARRDIVTCAACHDHGPATNCIRCHKVGGYGGTPHPEQWRSGRSSSAAMCRYCHEN